ncbi:MAG: hypothetical protein LBQ66_03800 [Planctomycetaceae bacterium]|nr:hypothetical protein [Planctomycetaceae bacterium]
MLGEFAATFAKVSEDKANKCVMIDRHLDVVDFDTYKERVASKFVPLMLPKSCDALWYADGLFYLIEFKNGTVNGRELWTKVFDSLLLLTEALDSTIEYTRENLVFVLVCQDDVYRSIIRDWISQRTRGTKDRESLGNLKRGLEKIYFKEVLVCNPTEFLAKFPDLS